MGYKVTLMLDPMNEGTNHVRILDPNSVFSNIGIGTRHPVRFYVSDKTSIRIKIGGFLSFDYYKITFRGGKKIKGGSCTVLINQNGNFAPQLRIAAYNGALIPPVSIRPMYFGI